jgi:hypothetical protein
VIASPRVLTATQNVGEAQETELGLLPTGPILANGDTEAPL